MSDQNDTPPARHTSIPPAEIEAVVKTENIGQVRVNASANPKVIFGENEEAIENDVVEQNAEEYLLKEFEEVVTITEVL